MLLFSIAALIVGCSLARQPSWGDAEMAARALPVPQGYTDAGLSRRGDNNCDIDPACEKPFVTRTFRATPPTSVALACDALHTALPSWVSAGLVFDSWGESATSGLQCILHGSLNGIGISADVSSGDIFLHASAQV